MIHETDARDPVLAAELSRALEPYRQMFPPEVVGIMEEVLEHALTTHPVGVALLDRVRPRKAQKRSGPQAKEATSPEELAKKAGAK